MGVGFGWVWRVGWTRGVRGVERGVEAHGVVGIAGQGAQGMVMDIAERLGLPVGTVKSRLHYGMRAMRSTLEPKGLPEVTP